MKSFVQCIFPVAVLLLAGCNGGGTTTVESDNSNPAPPVLSYNIVKVYPHDTASYTEGLFFRDGFLYESTGQKSESKLRKVDVTTGKAVKNIDLDTMYFGEGISMIGDKIYQLTWQEHKVFVYDATTFKKINEMSWPFEGWGMTTDSTHLIISTGGSVLYFVDPGNFRILKQVNVTDNYGPVGNVNELEYVNGTLYANVWQTSYIIKIDAETGKVTGKYDFTGLLDKSGMTYNAARVEVLNGIAYNPAANIFYITGKYWPALFEVKMN